MPDPIDLHVGGRPYRVVSSASPDELTRLAALVDDRLTAIAGTQRPLPQQALLLAALSLAHDLEEERERRQRAEERTRSALHALLTRIDAVLEEDEQMEAAARASASAKAAPPSAP